MVKLDVKYRHQLDNSTAYHGSVHRQCNLTANAMFGDAVRLSFGFTGLDTLAQQSGYRQGEDYYGSLVKRYGDTIYHNAQTRALEDLRIGSRYAGMPLQAIYRQLEAGYPVVTGVRYKNSGHIVCVVGYTDKFLWVHDPYGIRAGSNNWYQKIGGYGAYDTYSYGLWEQVHDGMGRYLNSFDGKNLEIHL